MHNRLWLVGGLLVAACAPTSASQPAADPTAALTSASELDSLAEAVWQASLARHPTWATFIGAGDRRFDAELIDLSEPAEQAWLADQARFRDAVAALDPTARAALDPGRRITADVIYESVANRLARAAACAESTWDVDQLSGYHIRLPELGRTQPLDSLAAAAAYVTRLSRIGALFDQHIDNLRRGLAAGRTAPRIVVERVIVQLRSMLAADIADTPYLGVLERQRSLSSADQESLRADIIAVVEHGVRPALRRYLEMLEQTYLPAARSEVGISSNPGGADCYRALIRHYTGNDLSPEAIHRIGTEELARLHGEMEREARAEGAGDWRAYIERLRADTSQYLDSREALVAHNEEIVARAVAALPQAFGRLPPISIGVIPIESFREKDAPAAYYYSASDDGSRPAYFYINTHAPETRPLFNMEALAFHEAVPGHHLQISIAEALEDLPPLRRYANATAFVEGWALYAEGVADELGLYSSPATRVGMLNYQAWRATRLVVDTGLHALGWSRERAVAFMSANVALPPGEIENEIDRYIIWPGQALAYMLGRMEIQRLRHDAEERLGPKFDIRDFHDVVIENGAVPLAVLRRIVDAWVSGEIGAVTDR